MWTLRQATLRRFKCGVNQTHIVNKPSSNVANEDVRAPQHLVAAGVADVLVLLMADTDGMWELDPCQSSRICYRDHLRTPKEMFWAFSCCFLHEKSRNLAISQSRVSETFYS